MAASLTTSAASSANGAYLPEQMAQRGGRRVRGQWLQRWMLYVFLHLKVLTCSPNLVADRTCVLAAAYGPKNVAGKKENAERATLEVVYKPQACCVPAVVRTLLKHG